MQAQGVRAARMCPVQHRYQFTEANVGDLLAALEAARIPLLVDFSMVSWSEEKTDWRSLDHLCARYPNLPFIVVGEGMAAPRRVFPLWRRHANLLLETSYYQTHQGLSDVASRFGADKLLFGTAMPVRAGGPPLMLLRYDFLSEADREAIGGGNLRRLLRGAFGGDGWRAEPPPAVSSHVTDLPAHPIIDSHTHLGTWFSTYIHAGEADGLIRSMDRLGIQKMSLIAFDAIGPDMPGGNDRTAAAMRAYPGRFLGYATVDPNEPEKITPELERCFDQLGFHGIKFHCDLHGVPADHDKYSPALEYADAHNLPVLIHGVITERMLKTYPRAQFLSAHVGGWDGRSPHHAVELSRDYPNIHLELCLSRVTGGVMEKLVEIAGADRIVFGTDAPLMDPGYQLGRVLTAKISPEDKEKILYRNAVKLFHLVERGEC
jgi:predicted TIM-barrel fold metal-dependent hydrolase